MYENVESQRRTRRRGKVAVCVSVTEELRLPCLLLTIFGQNFHFESIPEHVPMRPMLIRILPSGSVT